MLELIICPSIWQKLIENTELMFRVEYSVHNELTFFNSLDNFIWRELFLVLIFIEW